MAAAATAVVATAAVASPIATVGTIVAGAMTGGLFSSALLRLFPHRIVYHLSPSSSDASPIDIFERDALVNHGFLIWRWGVRRGSPDVVTISGVAGSALLRRAMMHVNVMGAGRRILQEATQILSSSGSASQYLQDAMANRTALGKRASEGSATLTGPDALALEMALNDESERRALEGELRDLEAAWHDAETIAQIADALPDVPRIRDEG